MAEPKLRRNQILQLRACTPPNPLNVINVHIGVRIAAARGEHSVGQRQVAPTVLGGTMTHECLWELAFYDASGPARPSRGSDRGSIGPTQKEHPSSSPWNNL